MSDLKMVKANGSAWLVDEEGNERPYRWYHGAKDAALGWWRTRSWRKLQAATVAHVQDKDTRFYGDGGTIHSSTDLDIGVYKGQVVSVWFRCQALPFRQIPVDKARADEMRLMYAHGQVTLHGVTVRDHKHD